MQQRPPDFGNPPTLILTKISEGYFMADSILVGRCPDIAALWSLQSIVGKEPFRRLYGGLNSMPYSQNSFGK